MQLKHLGSSSILLPEVGLGTSGFTGTEDTLRLAVENGASLIDTAEIYGTEELVGKAVRPVRDRVFIATKVAPRNFRRRDLIAAAENSLRRLGVNHIDLYQLHWPNYTVPIEESIGTMEDLVAAGKVRFVGVSNFSAEELRRAQSATSKIRIVSNQVRYSLIDRTAENELLDYCRVHNVTIIAYSPLGKGLPEIRACDPEKALDQLTRRSQKTHAQLALNWLIAKDNVIAIPRSSEKKHVLENCGASGWRLSPDEYSLLDSKIRFKQRSRTGLTLRRWKRRVDQSFGRQL
jgi:diketogulonate reductase-like aldo/keto reductase